MINKWTEYFTKWKFTSWFQEELDKVIDQREDVDRKEKKKKKKKEVDEIEICYLLSVLKASWLVDL